MNYHYYHHLSWLLKTCYLLGVCHAGISLSPLEPVYISSQQHLPCFGSLAPDPGSCWQTPLPRGLGLKGLS